MTEKNKPLHKLRDGKITATIWSNQTKDGKTMHSATFSRFYQVGEKLKDSSSFGRSDLLAVAKLASEAHSWIAANSKKEAA
jgi:hypothetical protein